MTLQKIEQLRAIVETENKRADELRKGTLYIVGNDGVNIASQMLREHEKRASDAANALDLLGASKTATTVQ